MGYTTDFQGALKLSKYREVVYRICLICAVYIAWFFSGGYPNGGGASLELKFHSPAEEDKK